jgi:predicted nucleotidyltransferase
MKSYIDQCVAAYDKIIELGYEPLVVNLYGSQNYEMETENSDFDFKAIVLPSIDDIIYNRKPVSTSIEFNGGLIDTKDIRLMWDNYKKQNPNFIETLFTSSWCINPKYADDWFVMRDLAEEISHADSVKAIKAMYGMALEKQHALCQPYPSKLELIEKYGYDSKQLSHIIRLYALALNYIEGEPYRDCLIPNDYVKGLCIKIKTYDTQLTAEKAQEMATNYMICFKVFVDRYLEKERTIDNNVYYAMDEIKARIMKKYFKEQLV